MSAAADIPRTAEESVAAMVGTSFTGGAGSPAAEPAAEAHEVPKFEFDEEFQTRIATLAVRDGEFMRRASHLLKPEYFENAGQAALVNITLRYLSKYGQIPSLPAFAMLLKDARDSKTLREAEVRECAAQLRVIKDASLADREYVEDKLSQWCRNQAVSQAILDSVSLLERQEFGKIEKLIKTAVDVGISEDGEEYDFFAKIEERTDERLDKAAGKMPPTGVTTGVLKMDEILYHKGWGKKELTSIMGGAKAGKTTALINFAKNASLAGKNVLYVTLEVAARIIAERLDASVSDNLIKELGKNIHDVRTKIEALQKRAGKLLLREYPSGTFTPNMLRALLERYKSQGIVFDLVVVDYADIMAPNFRFNDPIENSKSVYVDLRAIAFEFNVAMLTATQTNREGYKSTVAKAEHVAEDFNKVRTVDLMISINVTEEERAKGEARLYFAASRNQESGFTIFIKQDLAKMKFIESILRVE